MNLTLLQHFFTFISVVVSPARIKYGVNSGRNSVKKHWIPGQARNDKQSKGICESLK
jgi:hypothetical protein